MPSIPLTPAERQDLLAHDRRSADPEVRLRSHILLLLDAGHPWATVGAVLFCSASTIMLDGERALWEAQRAYFSDAVGVLDLFHVMERLWAVAHCFHKDGSDEAKRFVEERLRGLLEGRVGYVIGGLRQRLTKGSLRGRQAGGGGVGDRVPGEQPGAHEV